MVKVSFIIIGYNIEKYIEKSILSVINQSCKDIEIILVDDGSTDNTLKIMNEFKRKDDRIRVITQQNRGANAARKAGFRNASGEYIAFIDGDDWIDVNFANDGYKTAKENDCDIIICNFTIVYDDKQRVSAENIYENVCKDKYLELLLKQKITHSMCNKLYKIEFLKKSDYLNMTDISMGEDLATNIKLAINKPKVVMLNNPYYYYYQRSDSTTKKMSIKTLEIIEALENVENELKKNNIFEENIKEMELLWFKHLYISPIINKRKIDMKIGKKLYDRWKKQKIVIKENYLCEEIYESMNIKIKIKFQLFNLNFYLGYIYSVMINNLKKVFST